MLARLLCALWPYLAGALVAWLIAGRLAHKLKYQPAPAAEPGTLPPDNALQDARAQILALESELDAQRSARTLDLDRAQEAGFDFIPYADADDLTVIAGIEPSVCERLHASGIRRFDQLAQSDPVELALRLCTDDAPVSSARTALWSAQAALAAGNHWAALRVWQDLSGDGMEVPA